jgi:hypothetical protein
VLARTADADRTHSRACGLLALGPDHFIHAGISKARMPRSVSGAHR